MRLIILWALLLAAPTFAQLSEFNLTETQHEIRERMGPPKMTGSVSPQIVSWQFEKEEMEEGEFSHYLLFAKDTGILQGVTRNFPAPRNVDDLFPPHQTVLAELAPGFLVRARRFSGDSWLIAMGSTRPGDLVSQVLFMKESVLRILYPRFHT